MDNIRLLEGYEPVENGLYLRKDNNGIAAISSDGKDLGFLVIHAKSRSLFYGKGAVFENCGIENTRLHALTGIAYPNLAEDISSISDGLLRITAEHIKKFLSGADDNPIKMHEYLHNFSKVPCEDYATDTLANKARNAFATADLRYNPFKGQQRKVLRKKVESQISVLVDNLYQFLQQIKDFSDESLSDDIHGYEELVGQPLEELIGASWEEIESLLHKRVGKKIRFTAERNIAEYTIENEIDVYPGTQRGFGFQKHQYKIQFRLNC